MAVDGSIKIDTSIDRSKLEKDLSSIKQSLNDAGKTFEKMGGSGGEAYKKILTEFDRLEKNARAFGDVAQGAAEKKKYLKKQIETLVKDGMDPESEGLKALSGLYQSLDGASRSSGQIQKKSIESVLASVDAYENAVGVLNTKLRDGFIDEKKQREEVIALAKKQAEQLYAVGASLDNASSQGHEELKKITGELQRMEAEAAKSAKTLDDVKKEIADAGKISGTVLKAAAAAAAAMTAALTAAAIGFSNTADRIDKMSQSLSVSRDTFQKLDYVFAQNGASIDSFGSGIKSLQGQIDKTAKTTDEQSTALGRLGVSVTDANGKFKSQDDILLETLYAFNGIEEGVAKSALAQEIFGKSAQDIMPILNQQEGSIESLVKRAGELGLVLGDDAVNSGVALNSAITDLKMSGKALLNDAIGPLIPVVTESINNFISWAKENNNLRNIIGSVIDIFKILIPVTASAAAGLAVYFGIAKGKAIIDGLTVSVKALGVAIKNANPFGVIAGLITVVLIPAIILLYKNWDKVVKFFQVSFAKLGSYFSKGINSVKILFLNLIKFLLNGFNKIAKFFDLIGFNKAAAGIRGLTADANELINVWQEESRMAIDAANKKIEAINNETAAVQENAEIREGTNKRNIEGIQEVTEAEKKLVDAIIEYKKSVEILDRKLKDGYIDQKSYNEELLSLTNKQIETLYEMGYSLRNTGTVGGAALQKLVDKQKELNIITLTAQDIRNIGQKEYSIAVRKHISGLITENELVEANIKLIKQQIDTLIELGASTSESNEHERRGSLLRLIRYLDELETKKNNLDVKDVIANYDKAASILDKKLNDGYISQKQHENELINLTKQQIEAFYAMGYSLEDVSSKGGEALQELVNTLNKLDRKGNGFVSLFTEMSISIAKSCSDMGRNIKDTFEGGFKSGIEKVKANIIDNANKTWDAVKGNIKKSWDKIKSITKQDITEWARTCARAIDDAVPKIAGALKTVAKQTVTALQNGIAMINRAASFFQKIGKTAIQYLVKGFEGIKTIMSGFLAAVSALAVFNPIKLYESLDETIQGLDRFFNDYLLGFPTFFNMCLIIISDFIKTLRQNLPETVIILKNVIDSICSMMINDGPEIIGIGLLIISGLLQAIVSKAPDLLMAAVMLFKSFLSGINGELPGIMAAISRILPEIVVIISKSFPELLQTGVSIIKQIFDGISNNAPILFEGIGSIINGLLGILGTNGPNLITSAVSIITEIIKLIVSLTPNFLNIAMILFQAFLDGILSELPKINETINKIIPNILDIIIMYLPGILDTGIQIVNTLTQGIIQNIDVIFDGIATILCLIINKIIEYLPVILGVGILLFQQLVIAIIGVLPQIIETIIGAIPEIVTALIGAIPQLLDAIGTIAGELIKEIIKNIPGIVDSFVGMIPQIAKGLIKALPQILAAATGIGGSIIEGIAGGISGSADSGGNTAKKVGSTVLAVATGGLSKLFGFAGGTDYAPGGLAIVGEEGPELVKLKGGEKIYTADETSALLSGKGIQSIVRGLSGFTGINIPALALQAQPISIHTKVSGSVVVDEREIGRIAFEQIDHYTKATYGY